MPLPFDPSALHHALTLAPGVAAVSFDRLLPLPPDGLDNDHVRLAGTGLVARVPRWALGGLDPADALALRAARFSRAAASGHVPNLHAVLPPADGLPYGALVVDDVAGSPARVPDDMGALAAALAALHELDLPAAADRPPLPDAPDPAAALIDLVEQQSAALSAAGATDAVCRLVASEIDAGWRLLARRPSVPHPVCLVGTDTHPGNFLVSPLGRAVLVDLDKAMYGSPAVDLAHASLATSIFWTTGDWDSLPPDARLRFYKLYLDAVPPALAQAIAPWLAPMARLTWLRTTTWAATWRVERLPDLERMPGLDDLVARAKSRTAALLQQENVERQAAALSAWDAEEPA